MIIAIPSSIGNESKEVRITFHDGGLLMKYVEPATPRKGSIIGKLNAISFSISVRKSMKIVIVSFLDFRSAIFIAFFAAPGIIFSYSFMSCGEGNGL